MIVIGLILLMGFAVSGQCQAEPTAVWIEFNDGRSDTEGKCFFVAEAHLYSGRGAWRDGSPAGRAYNEQSQPIIADSSALTDCEGHQKATFGSSPVKRVLRQT